jgi:hypothetical protein
LIGWVGREGEGKYGVVDDYGVWFGRLNAGGELCMCILEFGFNYIGEQSIA